jgi:hypothetical protein
MNHEFDEIFNSYEEDFYEYIDTIKRSLKNFENENEKKKQNSINEISKQKLILFDIVRINIIKKV